MKIKLLPILLSLFLGSFAVSSMAVSPNTKFDQAATDGNLIFLKKNKDASAECDSTNPGCGVCYEDKSHSDACKNYRKALNKYEYCLQNRKREGAQVMNPHTYLIDCKHERNDACKARALISELESDTCPYAKVK